MVLISVYSRYESTVDTATKEQVYKFVSSSYLDGYDDHVDGVRLRL
jgi:hypothetical protein